MAGLNSGDAAQARVAFERCIAVEPADAAVHFDLARVRESLGDREGAITSYEVTTRLAPDRGDAFGKLGELYLAAGRREDALQAFCGAIRAQPQSAPNYCNFGAILIDLGRYDEAIRVLEGAVRIAPDLPEAQLNLGHAYRHVGRFDESIEASQRAIALRPQYREAYLNLSVAAFSIDAFELAFNASRRALELDATSAQSYFNFAWLCHATGRYAQAIDANEAAIAVRPEYIDAHANLALSLLLCGDFKRGWDEYVWTWRLPAKRSLYPYFDRGTLWNGESFAGRELLITREQGLGDAIQIVRFLPAIKARGGRVTLEVASPLAALFSGLPGVDELRIAENGTPLKDDVDLHVPLFGIPRALGVELTSLPGHIPYVRANSAQIERWRPRMESAAGLRVGIVWSGNADHPSDRSRSVRIEDFAQLGAIEGIAWFGLQKGRDEHTRSCGKLRLEPLSAEIFDFDDSAAILMHLDLVIAVDTAIVHLAGAMGKPVWTLLAFAPDWRWLTERADSPWYPTMRLFRQPKIGDWTSVFNQVADALKGLPRHSLIRSDERSKLASDGN